MFGGRGVDKGPRQRKQHAKLSPLSSPLPSTNSPPSQSLAVRPKTPSCPPPPYAPICPPRHTVAPQQQPPSQPPPPPPPTAPAITPPGPKPKNISAKPTVCAFTKPRKKGSALSVSRAARPVSQPSASRNTSSDQWKERSNGEIVDGDLCNIISSKLDAVLTSIDGEDFAGGAGDLEIRDGAPSGIRGGWGQVSKGANRAISTAVVSTNYFSKVNLYANSRLPPELPPLKL